MYPEDAPPKLMSDRTLLGLLLLAYVPICLMSLRLALHYTTHHLTYDPQQLVYALASTVCFCLISSLFYFARFSFGFFVGFYLYTMALGFIWLSWFTDFHYDLQAARISAAASAIAFVIPALCFGIPLPSVWRWSSDGFEILLNCLLAFTVVIVTLGASYNFQPVGLTDTLPLRLELSLPVWMSYAINVVGSSIGPFLFACFVVRRQPWRAGMSLVVLAFIYPITLTKTAFFSPWWLLGLALASRYVGARSTVVLTLLLPQAIGVSLIVLLGEHMRSYFDVVNFRMLAVPSSAMAFYGDFFSRHELTHFCQVTFLKALMSCPYDEPLYVVMYKAYGVGYFNASLFATEGIASVGQALAPAAVFVCGLVIAIGNSASRHLPHRFVLISSAILARQFLDVPLTIMMMTHGAALMFLLWYLTPAILLRPSGSSQAIS